MELPLLCDKRRRTLHHIEREVCEESRNIESVWNVGTVRSDNILHIASCLPGIELASCQLVNKSLMSEGFGITNQAVSLPNETVSCRYFFGEAYVYLSCLGQCLDAVCPLKPLISTSCSEVKGHVFTLSTDNTLTVARESRGVFLNDLFPCDNGNCVTLDKVCNNINDCGDSSDEANCSNSWHCEDSGEDIIYSAVCDGTVHCRDSSDECNGLCNQRVIEDKLVRISAWIIGISGTVLNVLVLGKNIHSTIKEELSGTARVVCVLVMWISLGDLLMGVYIISIVIVDQFIDCQHLIQWRISSICSTLGVINALSALLSTTAMTILSFYRMVVVIKQKPAQHTNLMHTRAIILGLSATIVIISLTFALLPVLGDDEYFTNGLYYGQDVPLFSGIVSKTKHIQVLEKYYGRLRGEASWDAIRSLVSGMFTDQYGGITPQVVGSYGVSNVCLFKYFVTPIDDHKTFVISNLAYFVLCFTAITINYLLIVSVYKESSARSAGSRTDANNRQLQRKIALMILTDFMCWGPFLICAVLHFYQIIDANNSYAMFSLIILPVNSVCNPLIYEDSWKKAVYERRPRRLIRTIRKVKYTKPSWLDSLQEILTKSRMNVLSESMLSILSISKEARVNEETQL